MPGTELLYSEGHAITATLHQSDGSSSTGSENLSKFSVFTLKAVVICEWNTGHSVCHRWSHNASFVGFGRFLAFDDRSRILVLLLLLIFVLMLVPNFEEPLQVGH